MFSGRYPPHYDRIPVLQLDPGAKNKAKMKQRYGSRKIVLKLELGSRFDIGKLVNMHLTQN